MKEKLLELLREHLSTVYTSGCSEEFLDTLAEDLMAVTIRAVTPLADDFAADIEHRVLDVYNDKFGTQLHNMFWTVPPVEMEGLPTSSFERISKAMIQTMLLEFELPGATINRRLQELNCTSHLIN